MSAEQRRRTHAFERPRIRRIAAAVIIAASCVRAHATQGQGDPLLTGDLDQRLAAVRTIREKGEAARVSDLVEALPKEEEPAVRAEIVETLGLPAFRTATALRSLSRATLEDLSDRVRRAAGLALMNYEGPKPMEVIDQAVRFEQGEDVRLAFALALSSTSARPDDPRATDVLARLLADDPSAAVRMAAVKGLDARGDKRALPALKRAADHDESPLVRERARKAFSRLFAPKKGTTSLGAQPSGNRESVKGKDRCANGNGWCQCGTGPVSLIPHCMALDECRRDYENVYRSAGMTCTWDGQSLGE